MTDRTPPTWGRPTTYKGIQMRSRLEASFAAGLDKAMVREPELFDPPTWEYEPNCFADERGQYLPDFAVSMRTPDGPRRSYIEVKPRIIDDAHWRSITDRMAVIWSSEPDAVLTLCEVDGERRHWNGVLSSSGPWWILTSPERAVA